MYAEWNESVCTICVPNCMNIDYNTGGGYHSCIYPSIFHAHSIAKIRGYVCPVINNVFWRQRSRMLSFLRVFEKEFMRYISAGDGWRCL